MRPGNFGPAIADMTEAPHVRCLLIYAITDLRLTACQF